MTFNTTFFNYFWSTSEGVKANNEKLIANLNASKSMQISLKRKIPWKQSAANNATVS